MKIFVFHNSDGDAPSPGVLMSTGGYLGPLPIVLTDGDASSPGVPTSTGRYLGSLPIVLTDGAAPSLGVLTPTGGYLGPLPVVLTDGDAPSPEALVAHVQHGVVLYVDPPHLVGVLDVRGTSAISRYGRYGRDN